MFSNIDKSGSRRRYYHCSSALAVAWMAMNASAAAAQDPSAKPRAQDQSVAEVVVTASKRGAVSIQKIAANISAVGAAQIKKTNASSLDDIMRQVPGVTVSGAQGNKTVVIRGLAASAGVAQVGIYEDEILLPARGGINVAQVDTGLFDIARVEVLRGPQGTLYGAGSQSGTVRYITNKPQFDNFSGAINGEVGARSRDGGLHYQGDGMLNIPLVDDKLAVRLVGFARHVDGLVDIPALGLKHTDVENTEGGRLEIQFNPTTSTSILATAAYQDLNLSDSSRVEEDRNARTNPVLEPMRDQLLATNLTIDQNVGFGTVTATISHIKRDNRFVFDQSQFVSPQYGVIDQREDGQSTVGELRFASKFNAPVQITTGLFFNKQINVPRVYGFYSDPTTGLAFPNRAPFYQTIDTITDLNKAAFLNGTWDVTNKLSVEAGFRYFDLASVDDGYIYNQFFTTYVGPSVPAKSSSSGIVKKAEVSYKYSTNVLLYLLYSEGFREGGYNAASLLGVDYPATYKPDFVKNYEFGFKSQLFDRQLTFNGAVYDMQWEQIQVLQWDATGAFSYTSNAGKADLEGIELEARANPRALPGFSINLSGRYSNQELSQDNPAIGGPRPNPYAGSKGEQIPYSTRGGGSVGVEQDFELASFPAYVRADATYTGVGYTEFSENDPTQRPIGNYTIVNLRAGIDEKGWSAALYAKNLTDTRGFTTWRVDALSGLKDRVTVTDPREVGISVGYKF